MPPASGSLVRGDADVLKRNGIPRHRQADVVGVVAERGIQERQVRGYAIKGAAAVPHTIRGEYGVLGLRRIVARAGQRLHRAVVCEGIAGRNDPIGLAWGIDLDLGFDAIGCLDLPGLPNRTIIRPTGHDGSRFGFRIGLKQAC